MNKKRIIVLDLASLGIGEAPDANRFNSVGVDTLGHVVEHAGNKLEIPNLIKMGLGNIRWDHEIDAIPQVTNPSAFYGKMVNRINTKSSGAGLREMFDFDTSLRTLSTMDLMSEKHINISMISSFASYLENQDDNFSLQVPNDSKAFVELSAQMDVQFDGLIYCQPPLLKRFSDEDDVDSYADQLSNIDAQLPGIIEDLSEDDLLIITSTFANDPSVNESITREYLPLIVYNPLNRNGKSLGIKRSSAAISNALVQNFDIDDIKRDLKPNFLNEVL
ncbi:alkaline phosphatase family protein [Apilactobacillus timberlakei]|uniref:Phosphopentomutase n=1 Tax=Apilactobacillus timberlakei TaxID=2008380 RepID=A0ABY2YT48_9LACO|nr:phosphopentomutase [Apilactobacillus timberlakei]TPR14109.1 phosphopentomutase [Apilactobacillus timberlakei]TPR16363.1 phosphopentomutase [Apilactobacillus timberlakei]TPR19057.1 phosphopentomutase [Apilactobacillus timberlakei]